MKERAVITSYIFYQYIFLIFFYSVIKKTPLDEAKLSNDLDGHFGFLVANFKMRRSSLATLNYRVSYLFSNHLICR